MAEDVKYGYYSDVARRDVCILMLDATRGIETQDMNIFQLIQKNNKSLVDKPR